MNLEQIDTSTTAGKAEVMRLAAEGRRVAVFYRGEGWREALKPMWNWDEWDFAIIAEPVGPEEVWVDFRNEQKPYYLYNEVDARSWASKFDVQLVRYIRADVARGEGLMDALLIAYGVLCIVHIVVDTVCCLIARSPFRPIVMAFTALLWPVMWPAVTVMAALMLKGMKDAGLVPESKGGEVMNLSSYKDRSRLSEASNAGYSARLARKPISSCPYPDGTDKAKAFQHAWGQADQDEHRRQGRAL